jgi:hypothetical protein
MKTKRHSQRRGSFLKKTRDSVVSLTRVFDRMMSQATAQGEARLLRRIFSC